MKVLITLTCILFVVSGKSQEELWKEYKKKYDKTYSNFVEEKLRFEVFKNNLREIEQHNEKYIKGDVTWYKGVNKFSDLTQDEFKQWLGLNVGSKPSYEGAEVYKFDKKLKTDSSLDWREKGAVLEVKNQGSCGACWAFSATGALEGQNVLINNKSISLSEQNLMDCTDDYGNHGCSGGNMRTALDYVIDVGIMSEADYSYTGAEADCEFDISKLVLKSKKTLVIGQAEDDLLQALDQFGPISVGMNAGPLYQYSGGILDDPECYKNNRLNHGILAVGYGSENGVDYFIIKNSWGADWGEKGFFKIRRNSGFGGGLCGIATYSTVPIL